MVTNPVVVHVGVDRNLQSELRAGGTERVRALAEKLRLEHVREDRLEMFGILTGQADASAIDTIRNEPGVEFVEEDSEQTAV